MKKSPNGGGVADMAKAVEGRWTLRDRVTPAIQRMNKETLKYKATVRNAQRSISRDWQNLKTGAFVVAAAVAATGYAVVSIAKSMTDAARESIEAETKLYAVLHNVKGVTDEQIAGLANYANALQRVGVVDGDVITAGVQQVATFQLQTSTIKTLMPGMADLIAQQKGVNATQEDAVTIGNLVGKVMNGQTSALSRAGISFNKAQEKILKYGNEQQKAATLAQVLKDNVGGVNAALAATDQGKIQQATNAWGDMKEQVGAVILMIEGKFAKLFMDNLPKIQSVVQKVSDGLANWANNGGVDSVINGMRKTWGAIKDVWNIISSVYNFFKNNWSTIKPIILGVAITLGVLKAAMVANNIVTVLSARAKIIYTAATKAFSIATRIAKGELTLMTIAQKGLNAAMKVSVIGLIVLAVVGLIAAGIWLVKNWEQVKLAGMKTWNVLVGAAQWAVNKYIDFANFMIRVYKFVWDSIKFGGVLIWNGMVSVAEWAVNKYIDFANLLIRTYKFAWDSIKFAGISIWNAVIDAAEGSVQKLLRPFNAIRTALGKEPIIVNFSAAKFKAEKPVWDSSFKAIPKVDFSAAKGTAVKPEWDSSFKAIAKVDFSGAKFSEDSIMAQTQKAQEERDKKNAAHTKALNDNTAALTDNTDATEDNTDGTEENTDETKGLSGTLKNGVSVNMTAEQIADGLFPRLERHLYGTS